MPPLPTLGTASSCFVPLANESSPLPGALSWPMTRFGAVEVQTPLPFTALHQSVPVFLTRLPSVLSKVLPVKVPLAEATSNTTSPAASTVVRPKTQWRRTGRWRKLPKLIALPLIDANRVWVGAPLFRPAFTSAADHPFRTRVGGRRHCCPPLGTPGPHRNAP